MSGVRGDEPVVILGGRGAGPRSFASAPVVVVAAADVWQFNNREDTAVVLAEHPAFRVDTMDGQTASASPLAKRRKALYGGAEEGELGATVANSKVIVSRGFASETGAFSA